MMNLTLIVVGLCALVAGGLIGWLIGGRSGASLLAERDAALEKFKAAAADLAETVLDRDSLRADRDEAKLALARIEADGAAREEAFAAQLAGLQQAKDALTAQFAEVGGKLLEDAQRQFLERADARFKQAEESTGQGIKALIQPVHERLQKYEEAVGKVEAERREAFGNLHGLMESMRVSNESVRTEAARLGNSLRNAPKARGRWGEQQLRNVLESCGLSEHADFQTEVSVEGGEGRLRPDAIIKIPGGHSLVIDAKVSLNAYQDAFDAPDEDTRRIAMTAHVASMKTHVNMLGAKAYWNQFEAAPDYVIMFVPGEHFLSAALEHDGQLWDYAFQRQVLLATPTNLIAIARTVSAVWKQEQMASQAKEIAAQARELYSRLLTMGGHVGRIGKNLDTAMSAYNSLVGSLESQVLTQARRFESLGLDTGGKNIESLPVFDQTSRPLVKLVAQGGEI